MAIKIIEQLADAIGNFTTKTGSLILGSIIDNYHVTQLSRSSSVEVFDLDVVVYHAYLFFEKIANELKILIGALKVVSQLIPSLKCV